MRKTMSAVVTAVAVAGALVPAAAHAGSAKINDGKGDTYTLEWDPKTEQSITKASKQKVNIDLDKMVVKHTDKRIEVTATYFSLEKENPEPVAGISVKTDDGSEFDMFGAAFKGPDGWEVGGSVYEPIETVSRTTLHRGGTECQGVKVHVDWKDDTLSVSAPRSCFRNPKWIKAHGEAVATTYEGETYTNYFDNAHSDKGNFKGWTDKIKKG